MTHAAILYNPTAGRGRAVALARELEGLLIGQGVSCQTHPTECAGDGTRLAQLVAKDVQRIFVVGGDGTLREVAAGVMRLQEQASNGSRLEWTAPALGHVPLGNANVVARELGTPLKPQAAIRALLLGITRKFDVMYVASDTEKHRMVLAVVGVGYDGELANSMAKARNGPLAGWYRIHGDSLYGAVGIWNMLKPGRRRLRIAADGEAQEGACTGCIVSNMRIYAKGWAPNPEANARDGLLDYQALRPSPVPSTAISLAAAALAKPLPDWLAVRGQGRSVSIEADNDFYWQADGDAMGRSRSLHIEVVPRALALIVPGASPH